MTTRTARSLAGTALLAAWLLLPPEAGAADKPSWKTAPTRTAPHSAQSATPAPPAAHIAEILRDPGSFRDRAVTLRGAFRGWKGNCKWSAMITRSDWVLDDNTGCIYVNGQLPAGLSPQKPAGEQLIVSGSIRIKDGKPVIRAEKISAPPLSRK